MKAIILAGGLGTRISEESHLKPKPIIDIGGKPIIWHIMKIYSCYGINDFLICLGYKGYLIKEYFANYFLHMSDVTFDMRNNRMQVHEHYAEPWRVTLVDTGEHTNTGGRLRRVREYLREDETFCFTYGDGVADVDIPALLGRYGALTVVEDQVQGFQEKPQGDGGWINGGFFVLSPRVIEYIAGDAVIWEREPLEGLARDGQLAAYCHRGFWQPMDTVRDKTYLEELWSSGRAPWKIW
jgi:glucose-1-phosphate cytidylyltransferase